MSVPAVKKVGEEILLPAKYTCDGANKPPTVSWNTIPHGTKELVLFLSSFSYEGPHGGPIVYWAVTGLKPTAKGITLGALPSGTVVGRDNSGKTGYYFCPAKGTANQYVFTVFALTKSLNAKSGFNGEALYNTARETAENKGFTGFTYKRS